MVSANTARIVVGIMGNIFSFYRFLSPLPTFFQIWKRGSVEHYSPAPYLATLINCMVWGLYGLPMFRPNNTLLLTINAIGAATEFVYIILFFIYSDNKKRLKVLMFVFVELTFIVILAFLALTLAHDTKERSMVVGIVGICVGIAMNASPLSVIKMVIITKSVEYMPFSLCLAGLFSGAAWTTYSLLSFDVFILVPNALGILLSVAQLLLHAVYYRSTQRQIAARQGNLTMRLVEEK